MEDAPFELQPLPLLRLVDGQPRQVCRLTFADTASNEPRTLVIGREGSEFTFSVDTISESDWQEILLPEVDGPCTARVELRAGDQRRSTEVDFAPVRRWQVYLVNHSHTDIGFTHTPSEVERVHIKNLKQALALTDATADWPDDVRYRWTCESAWQVQRFLRMFPDDRARLVQAVQQGTIEVEALYIHSYFDLLNREQLIRSLYFAQELREHLGIAVTSAMICDVPGAPWSLVDVMAAAGVRYLSMAPNNFLAPFHEITDLPRPFVWQGPAGRRVIVWYTDDPYWAYIEGARHGFWSGIDDVEAKLPLKLAALENEGYPFDLVQIQTGSDNRPLRLLPATIAREWNRRYLWPRLRITTPSEFFRHAETAWADRLPVVQGDWQSSWSQTTLHYPKEANESRRNHGTLDLWERTAALADLVNEAFIYPTAEIAATYDASLLFDEHSGPKGIWRPRSPKHALASIREGYEIFQQATIPARSGLETALTAATEVLSGGDQPEIVVWNLLSWPRDGEVEVELPADWARATIAAPDKQADSRELATHRFSVADVPGLGFKRYPLEAIEQAPNAVEAEVDSVNNEARLRNDGLEITVDSAGCITSLVDTRTGAELVDRAQWAGLNALVRYLPDPHGPEPGGDFNAETGLYTGIPVAGRELDNGTIVADAPTIDRAHGSIVVRTSATICETYQRDVLVRLRGDRVEIRNRLKWLRRPDDAEMLFNFFPFALKSPEIRHAGQFAIVDPLSQTLSGSSLDSFAVQNWLDLNASDAGVTIHSGDLALVDYGGIHLQHFLRQLKVENGVLAFRVASGRGLPPPERDPFGVGATIDFGFTLRPHSGTFDSMACTRFGEEEALPLMARPLPTKNPGEWKGAESSLVSLESATGVLTGLKHAERADGYVVRVWESSGRQSTARLSFPKHELLAAFRVTPIEGNLGRVDLVNGGIEFELAPFELSCYRMVVGR